jgi:hypothetical protein
MTVVDPESFVPTLEHRISLLTADTPRRWGTMTAHEMLCHLADSFSAMLGERQVAESVSWSPLRRRITRYIALQTPLPWPKGVPTLPEVNPHVRGTRPTQFDLDRAKLTALMRRFVVPGTRYAAHPMFGTMSRDLWMIWTFRHVDHHLRQFGR